MARRLRIVVMGGGTGTFTVLSGLKKHPFDLAAIVAMSDDGGSTGKLRDELGVLPPGDVRQSLVALSSSDRLMRTLMNYRFADGALAGHSVGNLLLSALEKITGSFDAAVEKAGEILRIEGQVIPVTLREVALSARVGDRTIRGESSIDSATIQGRLRRIYLEPRAKANPKALRAIRDADAIVIGPGNFYASLVPNLLVAGIPEAVRRSRAKKIYVCNLVTKEGHTAGFGVEDFTREIEGYLGGPVDKVLYNTGVPPRAVAKRYLRHGEALVPPPSGLPREKFLGADLVSRQFSSTQRADTVKRALIRHDPARLARLVAKVATTRP